MTEHLETSVEISKLPTDQLLLASIAISLKRIADQIEAADLSSTIHNAISSGIWDARPKS